MDKTLFNRNQMQSTASVHGLRLGTVWLASFGCTMYGMDYPFLGILGNFLGIMSIAIVARMIRTYRIRIQDISWLQSLWFALTICTYATLITTFGQYLYFAFIDQGHFIHIIEALFQNPQYTASLKQSLPDMNTDQLLEALASLSTRDLIMQFLFMNMLASGACALIGSLMGGIGKVQVQSEIKSKQ